MTDHEVVERNNVQHVHVCWCLVCGLMQVHGTVLGMVSPVEVMRVFTCTCTCISHNFCHALYIII